MAPRFIVSDLAQCGWCHHDQQWHYGVSISAAAIIDKKTLKKHKKKIPKQYRSQLKKMDEINSLGIVCEGLSCV